MDERTKESLKDYLVIELASGADTLSKYYSCNRDPSEFYLKFITYGHIEPREMMVMVCENLIERLTKLLDKDNLIITASQSEKAETKILIRGEQYIIAELLKREIYKLDPNIGLVNSTLEHHQIRVVTVNLIHPQSLRIFVDAVESLIDVFETLKSQFSGDVVVRKVERSKKITRVVVKKEKKAEGNTRVLEKEKGETEKRVRREKRVRKKKKPGRIEKAEKK